MPIERITGLASGFDTEGTIAKLMKAQRVPLDKLKQQKQLLEWQRDAYRSLNSKIVEFRNIASSMKFSQNYLAKKVTTSNDSIVTATGTAAANEGIYTIKIGKLATSASVTSGVLGGNSPGDSQKLTALGLEHEAVFTVTGDKGTAAFQLDPDMSLGEFVATVNGKSNMTGVKVTYDFTMDKLFFVSSSTGEASKIELKMQSTSEDTNQDLLSTVFKLGGTTPVKDGAQIITGSAAPEKQLKITDVINKDITDKQKLKITVAGTDYEYEVSNTTTVSQLIDSINADMGKKTGVSAYLDAEKGQIAFFNPGSPQTMSFESSGTDLLKKLGLDGTPLAITDQVDFSKLEAKGQNAEIYFNGATVATEYATNNFSIGGINFTAKKESSEVVNITVNQDVDTVFNTIKSFVDKYNELIDTVNKALSEKRYRDYQPLTDDQRKDMKDDDIKLWEEKAKSGLLRSDPILTSGLSNFRKAFSDVIQGLPQGQLKSMAEIGISTSIVTGGVVSGDYTEKGKLYIDEAKLKKALSEKPEEVMNLFTRNDGVSDSDTGDGLAVRLFDKATVLFNNITAKAGVQTSLEDKYTMGKSMKDLDKRIDALTRRLEDVENRYYKQFTSMETYINQMNSQSNWLAQQFNN